MKGLPPKSALKTLCAFLLTSALGAQTVNVWETTADQTKLLAQQANVSFAPDSGTNSYTIILGETTTYQTIDGFGAAMCDSSGFALWNDLTTAQRNAAMTQMFDPNNGIGLSLCRLPMGASDMAVSNYSYDDNGGAADPTMAHFSIAHDMTYIVPLLKQAVALNPNLKIMGTPWSPPGWMKDSGTMKGGNFLPQYYGAYAQYFVKFIQAYQAQGIPIWSISCQNEPLYNATGYPGMYFPATQELEFIRNYLGPALEAAGLNTKILVYDHNWDQYVYPQTVLGDPVADYYSFGTAWHWYGGVVTNQQFLETGFPNKGQWITEAASGAWTGNFGQAIVNDGQQLIVGGTQNWSKGAIKWPLVTDQNYGPQNGGCNTCWGLITADSNSQTYSKGVGFYTLGHASKFVQPGAYHIQSNTFGGGNIEDTAFKNPDGSDVVVVFNSSGATQSFKILLNGKSFTYSLPDSAMATFKWSGGPVIAPPTATPTPQASTTWRVVAGGPAHTDCQSNLWSADTQYVGGTGATSTNAITGGLPCASDTALYQDQRYGGSFLYAFQVPAGSYQVTLKFAETYWTAVGQRVFNVSLNGNNLLTNFDILAAAGGQNKAVDKVFNNIQPDALGRILIQFGPASADNALVSSIQIVPMTTPTFTPTPTRTASMTPTASLTATPSPTRTFTPTWTATPSNTNTRTNTPVPPTSTFTTTFTRTYTATPSFTPTSTSTFTRTNSATDSMTPTASLTATPTASPTRTPTFSATATRTSTSTASATATDSTTPTSTRTSTLTNTSTSTTSFTSTATSTNTSTLPSDTPTSTSSMTATSTGTSTSTGTATFTSTATSTSTSTSSNSPTASATSSFTSTATSSFTASPTSISTATGTPTFTSSYTATSTRTASFTATLTASFTSTASGTPSFTRTFTSTPTSTFSMTNSPTATASFTKTSSFTPSFTLTFTRTSTSTFTVTSSMTATPSLTASRTFTATSTSTKTLTPTPTPGTSACSGVPTWNGNFVQYSIGAKATYNGELYQCIQAHASESTWEPNVTPALWQDLGPCAAAKSALVYPNPSTSSGQVQLSVPLTQPSDVNVAVYTTNFRKVAERVYPRSSVGTDLSLELVDGQGTPLANGLYYVAARGQGKTWILKLLILH